MYRLDREDFVRTPYISLWSLLGFQAGFVNAFGFLACGRYVSHITGFGTQIGVAAAEGKPWIALELLGFPVSFIFGAFFSGTLSSARLERGLKPRYDLITLFLPVTMGLMLLLGKDGIFGVFGEPFVLTRDFALLFMLSFVCGMQNGCFATMTRGQIRTTHLTGIGTDLGTDLARLIFGRLQGNELRLTQRVNLCRFATVGFFSLGSVISVFVGRSYEYRALWVPVMTSTVVYIAVRAIERSLNKKMADQQKINAPAKTKPVLATQAK